MREDMYVDWINMIITHIFGFVLTIPAILGLFDIRTRSGLIVLSFMIELGTEAQDITKNLYSYFNNCRDKNFMKILIQVELTHHLP